MNGEQCAFLRVLISTAILSRLARLYWLVTRAGRANSADLEQENREDNIVSLITYGANQKQVRTAHSHSEALSPPLPGLCFAKAGD